MDLFGLGTLTPRIVYRPAIYDLVEALQRPGTPTTRQALVNDFLSAEVLLPLEECLPGGKLGHA
jgi:hypothetical protein